MQRRTLMAAGTGALLGVIGAVASLAFVASQVLEDGVAIVVDASGSGRAIFTVTSGAAFLWVVVAGLVGGALLGVIAYVIGREAAVDSPRIGVTPVTIMGATIGALVAFAVVRSVFGIGATIEGGILTVSVFRAILAALTAGAVAGAVVGMSVERLSRREALGLEGVAWPASRRALVKDIMAAMGAPLGVAVAAAGGVFLLSRLILGVPHEVGLIIFGGAAALVLALGALVAAMPPSRTPDE